MTRRPPHHDAPYDAVIVGGGPAGLSAALVLGRANKRVLVIDDDRPANAVSQGVGGLLGHDRVKPADLRRSGRQQLEAHANVEVGHGAVEDVEPTADGFVVTPTDAPPGSGAPSVHSTTSRLQAASTSAERTAPGPLPWNARGRSRTSQPSQNAQWNTDRPQSASTPGSGGGSKRKPCANTIA